MTKKSKMMKVEAAAPASRIALYLRVSTDKQREEGYSIDIQKERLLAYAGSLYPGVETELFIDDGFSGGNLDRPEIKRLIACVKDGEVSHIAVLKLDRLSRSQKDTLYLIEDVFLAHNVAFLSMNENFNTATPFGRAVIGILSVFAQLERENIFERTRSGMQKRVEAGLWPGGGRVPFGYDYDAARGILTPNQDAGTVRQIYDLYIKGYSLQSIANMCGLKYEKLAYQILNRKSNAGYIVYNGVEYQGQHTPLISLETYETAMALAMDRSAKRFVTATDHLLTGLVYCGTCGAKMRYQKWGKAGNKMVCYSQQKSKAYLVKDPNCDNGKPWADELEEVVLHDLFHMAQKDIDSMDGADASMTPLELFQSQYDALEKKLKRLYHLYATDGNDVLLSAIDELRESMDVLRTKIQIESERSVWQRNLQRTKEELKNVQALWPNMSVQEKQNILRSVVDKIVVTDSGIHVDYKF